MTLNSLCCSVWAQSTQPVHHAKHLGFVCYLSCVLLCVVLLCCLVLSCPQKPIEIHRNPLESIEINRNPQTSINRQRSIDIHRNHRNQQNSIGIHRIPQMVRSTRLRSGAIRLQSGGHKTTIRNHKTTVRDHKTTVRGRAITNPRAIKLRSGATEKFAPNGRG